MQTNTLLQLALCLLTINVNPALAFWRLPCQNPIVVQRSDPVVSPGSVSGHVHTIMGGNGFGFSMNYASTQASTCTSCTVTKDLSNYWTPTLYYRAQNGSFISVGQNGGVTVYYLQRSDPLDPEYSKGLLAFPEGFRMVAGNPFLRSYNASSLEQQAVTYVCLGTDKPQTNGFPNYPCPYGLRTQVFFPSCWDGKNLDSPDHKSHMAYPSLQDSGNCPSTHPKRFVSIFYEILWNTPDFADKWYGNSQPFVWSMGDPTGYGFHGDFVNGWDVPTLQRAVNECTDESGVIEKCPVFQLTTNEVANGCRVPPSVHEQISGVLPKLPGCNEVQNGPGNASPQSGCGATTTIGTPMWPYTDVTKSKSFAYMGCGFDTPGMTIEKCIDYCNSKGFSIAGLEYSTQCFCDNKMLAGRDPVAGLVGGCTMPCSGNDKQICGDAGLLSLYKKCPSSNNCANIQYPFNTGPKKRKSEERRERRQKRDSEYVCPSNSVLASSFHTSVSPSGSGSGSPVSSSFSSSSSSSSFANLSTNSLASSTSPSSTPAISNLGNIILSSPTNNSPASTQASSASRSNPAGSSVKHPVESTSKSCDKETNASSLSHASGVKITTVITTTTTFTTVTATA
ncbi:putative wsc domain protein [Botrytis fragariae]|uniref:Putative wsc domain protein n=1 Tax=Botrytis fragariae TaxID=1964551 RepID=A0A8H6AWT4_9HELO|nr:putative wsc domain protein [Botrytis fragariae]KAF5875032.1 putative wsc domain protein [Botrytis fragariae]